MAPHVVGQRYTEPVTRRSPSLASVAAWLKSEALQQGFALAGITSPEPPPHLDRYEAWLSAGRHGEMAYLATERGRAGRADPRHLLPGCQSILVLAAHYAPAAPPPGPVHIAAYARGEDYHHTLPARAQVLIERLQHRLGRPVASRIYCDAGPLLERELAQRAGLGWIGRNTCLINPTFGSMTLLTEVLLDLALPTDAPFEPDRCGSCHRCLDACPTGCILPDRTLDARRCLSYLTIESRTGIPRDLRPALDSWLFGCDICQMACPWNAHASSPTADPAFSPRPSLDTPDPAVFLISPPGVRLRGSPLQRARRAGLARNAAVVAGNLRAEQHIDPLGHALLTDPDPMVRGHAAWALGEYGEAGTRGLLLHAREREVDPGVLEEIDAALGAPPRAPTI